MKAKRFFNAVGAVAASAILAGCGGGGEPDFAPYDNSEEVEAYYRENADFFVFATPGELPQDLVWENGMDLPELGSPEAKKGGTFYSALPDFPRTLRLIGPDSNGSFRPYILDWVQMALAHKHGNTEAYFPGVAKEWAVDTVTRTVYVRLDPDARWSDGVPITVDDVFFTFYFQRSPHNQAPFSQNFYSTKHSKLVRYDDRTFSMTVKEARPDFVDYVLQMTLNPRHFYTEFGPDFVERYQWRFQPTTGPYVLEEGGLRKGQSITLTRNDKWWARDRKFWRYRYNPDQIQLKVIRDPNKSFEAFKKGDLTMAALNLSEYWYDKLPDDDPLVRDGFVYKVTFYNDIPRSGFRLWLNTSKPLLDNIDVRLGIQFATNFELVNEQSFHGDWSREQTTSEGYGDPSHPTLRARRFSVEEAEKHFAKAGFSKRGPDGILVNDQGQRLSFTVSTGYKTFADALTILKQEAAKAGLELKLEVLDATTGWKKAQEKRHEITLSGFSTSASEVYPRYWDFFHSDNAYQEDGSPKPQTNNLTCTGYPELDKVIDAYEAASTHDEKCRLAHQIEEMVYADAAVVPGLDIRMFRVGFWRWVKWPEDFNLKRAEYDREWFLFWIDEAVEADTRAAKKEGRTFPPVIRVYDQYRRE